MNEFNYLLLLKVVCNVFLLVALEARVNRHAAMSTDIMLPQCLPELPEK